MKRDKTRVFMIIGLTVLAIIWLIGRYQLTVSAEGADPFTEPIKVRATCYCDEGVTASGAETKYGIVASKPEYIGCVVCVNAMNDDGSIGEFIGFFEVLDTGYGRETGVGESNILKGKTLGTIETGETIDFFMPTQHQAEEWIDTYGDYVYIKLVQGVG